MIAFILNNRMIKTQANPSMPLLDFIRYEQQLTGTKIGCREGDCGACTALVGTLQSDGKVAYQSITSCISPLQNAHGKHIVTVEGTNLPEELNVVQQAMKDHYATQCGFCTPGFVVSLTGFTLSDLPKTSANALDAISGNICRCTGYKSIINAAQQVCDSFDDGEGISRADLMAKGYIPKYFETIPQRLSEIPAKEIPQTATKTFVAGGTDLYVQRADALQEHVSGFLASEERLRTIEVTDNTVRIGAGATVTDLWNHKQLNEFFPNLRTHLKLVSSEQIRNMASFGGNIVNASPIGDMTQFFLAFNSTLHIENTENKTTRVVALRNFYKGYKQYDLAAQEIITAIEFKVPHKNSKFNFEKVCKRTHLDIASVNSAITIQTKENRIEEVHVAIGGVAATPLYLQKTASFLQGKELSTSLIIEANKVLQYEIAPIADVRGSVAYKRLLARQLFFAHFVKTYPYLFQLTDFLQYA